MFQLKVLNKYYKVNDVWKLRGSIFKTLRHRKKLFNLLHSYYCILKKEPVVKSRPFGMMMEPTIKCNLKCKMCAINLLNPKREGGYFKFDDFKKIIDEAGDYLVFVQFWFSGEPLLNKDLFKMIKYTKTKDIFTIVTSNLQLLTPESAKELVSSGLDYLNISFNGGSKESYEKYMPGGKFARVIRNIGLVVKERENQKKRLPFIDMQCIIMKGNESETEKIKELGKNLNVDRVSFKVCTTLSDDVASDIMELLPKNTKYRLSSYKIKGPVNRCPRLWYLPVINWDGTVVCCCNDVRYSHKMGNAFDKGLMAVWNSKNYVNFRSQVTKNMDAIDICRNCAKMKYKKQFIDV